MASRGLARAVWLRWLLAVALHAVAAAPAAGGDTVWKMTRHSFDRTLTYDNGLGFWLSSAGTMALRNRVQLLPPVADRYGIFWHKKVLHSDDFEVSFTISSRAGQNQDGQFAFWLSPDNFTETYDEQAIISTSKNLTLGLQTAGLTLLANRPTFRGLAVIFSQRNQVTAVFSDGKEPITMEDLATGQTGKRTHVRKRNLDWTGRELQVKLRLRKNSLILQVVHDATPQGKDPKFSELMRLPNAGTWKRDENFFGFSGYSGISSALTLELLSVNTRNFNMQTVGEDDAIEEIEDGREWMKVLEQEKRYVSQASQKEAVVSLTKLLSDHVNRSTSFGEQLRATLAKLEGRLDSLGGEFRTLVAETQAFDFSQNKFDPDQVRQHIKRIGSILSKEDGGHSKKMEEVHSVAKGLKVQGQAKVISGEARAKVESVAEQAKSLELHAAAGSTQTSFSLLALVLAVAGLGLLFLNRMRYYEKKHYI
mmetsp:Transcript_19435/g.42461  ORF Transcript_19435/g.42461 Transcript_19435/m.42461 type:complete len:479 (-) Transcript_19435:84-1520(-)